MMSVATTSHTARPSRVGRSPNIAASTLRPPSCAKNTATAMKPASCTAVSAIVSPGGTCDELTFTPSATAGMSTSRLPITASTSPLPSAANASSGGHDAGGRREAAAPVG